MTRRKMLLMTAGATVLGVAALIGFADHNAIFADDDEKEGQEALIKTLGAAKISLQQGLAASAQEGQPISAKSQSAALATAKTSLKEAVDKAAAQSASARVVSAVPSLKDGHPVASIVLLDGERFKTVQQRLD